MEISDHAGNERVSIRRILKYGFSALILTGLILWVIWGVDYFRIYEILRRARLGHLIWVPIGYVMVCFFRTLRLHALREFSTMDPVKLFSIVSIHSFWNNILPARSGEVTFLYLTRRHFGMELGHSAGILTTIRLYDFLITSMIFFGALSFYGSGNNSGILLLGSLLILAMCVIIWQLSGIVWICLLLVDRCPFFPKLMREIGRSLGHFYESILSGRNLKTHALLLVSTLPCNISSIFLFHMIMVSLDIDVSVMQTAIGSTFALFSVMLPFNAPGNTGLLDAGWVLGFLFVGVDKTRAVVSALIMHFMLLVSACFVGFLGTLLLRIRVRRAING